VTYLDENGGRFIVFIRDITERKQAEQQQAEYVAELKKARQQAESTKSIVDKENAKLMAMISGMDEGVIFADVNNNIIRLSDKLRQIF